MKSFHEKLFQKEKVNCYGLMPGDFQVICGSMVGKNCQSPATTETPAVTKVSLMNWESKVPLMNWDRDAAYERLL